MKGRQPEISSRTSDSTPAFLDRIVTGLAWRYICHSVMLLIALLHEPRAAPRVPDTLLDIIPRVDWVWRYNYYIWIAAHIPLGLWLWKKNRSLFLRFLYVGGIISLLRGLCVPLTGLGPLNSEDVNAGLPMDQILTAWLKLINPFQAVVGEAAHLYMTKDMFFSGHVATTFLLWLYCRRVRGMGSAALVAHILVTVSVFVSHLHYTIDVIGAWAIAYCVYVVCERWLDSHSYFTSSAQAKTPRT